ncbi:MAG TPA: hypothetical protein VNM90_22195 [Haliangium sp.]|nr:hypothetical protein [Haliangium sp.]
MMLDRCSERTASCSGTPGLSRSHVATALLGLGLCLAPPQARANPYSFHVEGAASVAWTDNTANRPEVAGENQTIPEAGFFTQLRPSLLFTYEAPRSVHVSAASVDINLFATQEPANAYNGSLNHSSLFALSPVMEGGLGATLGFGRVDPLILAQVGEIQGDTTFRSGAINQSLRWQATRDWRLDQGFAANLVSTEQGGGDTVANSVSMSLGADRAWARTALGLVTNASYVTIDQGGNASTQLITNLSANVRRDLDPLWSASASAGVGFILVTDQPEPPNASSFAPTPTGSLTVNYVQPLGTVTANISATVGHAITPNLLLGNVTNTSSATLNAGVPLPWLWRDQVPVLAVAASAGVAHSRPSLGDSEPNWNTISANGVASWSIDDGLSMALRYQFARIDVYGDAMDTAVQPPEDFFRHTILIEATGRFPSRQAAQLPDRVTRRVDRSNEAPIGGEQNEQARGDGDE